MTTAAESKLGFTVVAEEPPQLVLPVGSTFLPLSSGACALIEGRHETSGRHDAAASALIFDREGRDAIEKAE
jgi:hypothetical protein